MEGVRQVWAQGEGVKVAGNVRYGVACLVVLVEQDGKEWEVHGELLNIARDKEGNSVRFQEVLDKGVRLKEFYAANPNGLEYHLLENITARMVGEGPRKEKGDDAASA